MKYEHGEYSGEVVRIDDCVVFEFKNGNPHANVMPVGIMPCLYIASIGGKQSYRYPWHQVFTDKKLDLVPDFKLSETGSVIYECVRSIMNFESPFELSAWKENMKMILVRISDQCTEKKAAEGISAALRSLVKLGKISYNKDTGMVTVLQVEKLRGIYTLYEECKKWLSTKESGITLRASAEIEEPKPKRTYTRRNTVGSMRNDDDNSNEITIEELILVCNGSIKVYEARPKVIREISSGFFTIGASGLMYSEDVSDMPDPIVIFRTVQEAAEVAFAN